MTKVFIGGSRCVSHLSADVMRRLDRIIDERLAVLVGDADGADKAVQGYLRTKRYGRVEVFCSGGVCRNNIGDWPIRAIDVQGKKRDFAFYARKDRAMSREAAYGFMIWDGASRGTLLNALRLIRQEKAVVVYAVPEGRFSDLKNEADWEGFVSRWEAELRQRVEREWMAEARAEQPSLGARHGQAVIVSAAGREGYRQRTGPGPTTRGHGRRPPPGCRPGRGGPRSALCSTCAAVLGSREVGRRAVLRRPESGGGVTSQAAPAW